MSNIFEEQISQRYQENKAWNIQFQCSGMEISRNIIRLSLVRSTNGITENAGLRTFSENSFWLNRPKVCRGGEIEMVLDGSPEAFALSGKVLNRYNV